MFYAFDETFDTSELEVVDVYFYGGDGNRRKLELQAGGGN